jgi:predicted secreted protein
MAALTGKGGTVLYAGGSVASIGSWSMDIDNAMHDITSFTTSAEQWRTFAAGLSGWTGSLDGVGYDSASTGQANLIAATLTPVSAAVVLELDQTVGGKLTGTAFLNSASLGADIDGMTNATWSMQGTGSVAFTTST